MKKRILIGTLLVFASLALVIGISGCDLVLYLSTDIDGRVVNAKEEGTEDEWWKYTATGDTLEGATVQLFRENSSGTGFETTAYQTGTIESDGTYDMFNVPTGRYKLSGTKSEWIFVPRVITISGADATLPDLIAYPNPGGVVDNSIIIVLSWENLDHDLDAHLSYSVNGAGTRDVLNVDNPTAYSGNLLFERDVTDSTNASYPRVETILVSDHDFPGSRNDTDFTALSNPPDNQLRYYVYCFNTATSGISLTGEDGVSASAWGQVDVMYGSTHYGSWELPYNTAEDQLWVVSIDAIDDPVGGGMDYFWIYSANNSNYVTPPNFKGIGGEDGGIAVPVDAIK